MTFLIAHGLYQSLVSWAVGFLMGSVLLAPSAATFRARHKEQAA